MLLFGFFLLIAKYTNPELWEEGETGGPQRAAELPAKDKGKEKRSEKGVSDKGKYNFKESGIGNSWLIGNNTGSSANAYVNGLSGCEETLEIPHELTDESGNTKKVEVIGQFAFFNCGDRSFNGTTCSIVLSRYIKVIKTWGLGGMDNVTSFRIEEGSCLESIESFGLTAMNWENTGKDAGSGILVLPSTVTSIAEYGLYRNNLIKIIYYCGSTHLSNYSDLVSGVNAPDIKVTSSYIYDTIFERYVPKNDSSSIAEAEEKCRSFGYDLTKNYTSVPVKGGRLVTGWSDGNKHCPPSVDIPKLLEGVTVVAVNDSAFSGCNKSKAVSLPPSLKKVGREAFASCGANADAGFVLTIPSGANLSEGSFSNTNVELVFW